MVKASHIARFESKKVVCVFWLGKCKNGQNFAHLCYHAVGAQVGQRCAFVALQVGWKQKETAF